MNAYRVKVEASGMYSPTYIVVVPEFSDVEKESKKAAKRDGHTFLRLQSVENLGLAHISREKKSRGKKHRS